MISNRHMIAEERRQKILDYLADGERRTVNEILAHLSDNLRTVRSTLYTMLDTRELDHEVGKKRGTTKFWSLVRTTASAESRYASTHDKAKIANKFHKANLMKRTQPPRVGVTIHTPSTPIPNQRGQGCMRAYGRRVNQDTM